MKPEKGKEKEEKVNKNVKKESKKDYKQKNTKRIMKTERERETREDERNREGNFDMDVCDRMILIWYSLFLNLDAWVSSSLQRNDTTGGESGRGWMKGVGMIKEEKVDKEEDLLF